MAYNIILLLSIATFLQGTHAVDYTITNTDPTTPGSVCYTKEIGDDFTLQTLSSATDFIWNTFQQTTSVDRKDVTLVRVFLTETDDGKNFTAFTSGDQIHISTIYISEYPGDVKNDIKGVLHHEMTHVWQWDGNGNANDKLFEGIANYVRLKAGLAPSDWGGPSEVDRWDQRSDVTAQFLNYCDGLKAEFVAELNKKMRDGYSDGFFMDLLGKSVDQLWSDYKAS